MPGSLNKFSEIQIGYFKTLWSIADFFFGDDGIFFASSLAQGQRQSQAYCQDHHQRTEEEDRRKFQVAE